MYNLIQLYIRYMVYEESIDLLNSNNIGIVTDLENHLMALATSITNGKLKSNFPYLF